MGKNEIVGYHYMGRDYCASCIVTLPLLFGKGMPFDGWMDITGLMSAEANLNELAIHFAIDRSSAKHYEFPEIVTSDEEIPFHCSLSESEDHI